MKCIYLKEGNNTFARWIPKARNEMHFCQLRNDKKTAAEETQNSRKRNWNIFISQTSRTGRANDTSTGRMNSGSSCIETSTFSIISPRVHAQKVIISTCCSDGHNFLFFGIFSFIIDIRERLLVFGNRKIRFRLVCVLTKKKTQERLCIALIFWFAYLSLAWKFIQSFVKRVSQEATGIPISRCFSV